MAGLFTFRTPDDNNLSFLQHAEVLRYAIMRSVLVALLASVIAFFFKDFLYDQVLFGPRRPDFITNQLLCRVSVWLNLPSLCINQNDFDIISTEMAGQFKSHLFVTLIAGMIITIPYLLWEMWMFIKPALKRNESHQIKGFVFYTSFLFLLGVSFGYFVIAPLAIDFLTTYTTSDYVSNRIVLSSYVGSVSSVCLATGVVFELPVVIYFLSRMGIVGPDSLKKFRKHSIVGVFIVAAIITPPDVFSQFLVAIPMIILYEASILVAKRVYPKD